MYTTAGGAMAQEESTRQQELDQKRQYCVLKEPKFTGNQGHLLWGSTPLKNIDLHQSLRKILHFFKKKIAFIFQK
jgi:hypothetical protein